MYSTGIQCAFSWAINRGNDFVFIGTQSQALRLSNKRISFAAFARHHSCNIPNEYDAPHRTDRLASAFNANAKRRLPRACSAHIRIEVDSRYKQCIHFGEIHIRFSLSAAFVVARAFRSDFIPSSKLGISCPLSSKRKGILFNRVNNNKNSYVLSLWKMNGHLSINGFTVENEQNISFFILWVKHEIRFLFFVLIKMIKNKSIFAFRTLSGELIVSPFACSHQTKRIWASRPCSIFGHAKNVLVNRRNRSYELISGKSTSVDCEIDNGEAALTFVFRIKFTSIVEEIGINWCALVFGAVPSVNSFPQTSVIVRDLAPQKIYITKILTETQVHCLT